MHAFIELLNEFLRRIVIVLMTVAVIVLMMLVIVTRGNTIELVRVMWEPARRRITNPEYCAGVDDARICLLIYINDSFQYAISKLGS